MKRCLRGQQDEVLSIASLVSPAPKLRKLGSRGQLGASPTSVGTTSEVGSDDMPSLQLAGPRDCLGCLRNSETGRAWPDPDIPIEWTVESNRGAWCKDCHNVWRNVVKAGMSLTVYELHLSSNPSHRLKHWQYLAAYIMLRSEGILRLSKELLDARRTSISLFCDLLGVPFGPFVVVPRPLSPGSDTLLCMYQDTAEGPISLRCLQPVSMSKSIENVMHVPARGVQPLIPIMRVDCGHDKRWLQHLPANEETDHPGSVDTAGAASSSSKVIAELEEGMRLPYGAEGEAEPHWLEEMGSGLTKTEVHAWRKANQAFLATLATLAHLLGLDVQTEGWAKPVTKLLKSHMLKLGRIRNELITVPYKRYLDEVDNMTRATVSAQTFVREVGVYFRKYRNLGAVHQAGKDMWDWIGTLSKAPQMSLAVHEIVFIARVHSLFASRGSVGEAVECIVGSEGAALLERLETANKQDSAACVEFVDVILLDGFRVMCESFGDQPESKDVCPELARELQPLVPFLKGFRGISSKHLLRP